MERVELPEPVTEGGMAVSEAIRRRRSRRHFTEAPVSVEHVGQLLWAAQGITGKGRRKRAAPSAGATYPMALFVATGPRTAGGMAAGVYHYVPGDHALEPVFAGDVRAQAAEAALGQDFIEAAPLTILMAADYAHTARRYGDRATRYVDMEAGHISQNIYLQAEALGLGTVAVGAFRDEAVSEVFRLPADLSPLYLMPIGYPADS